MSVPYAPRGDKSAAPDTSRAKKKYRDPRWPFGPEAWQLVKQDYEAGAASWGEPTPQISHDVIATGDPPPADGLRPWPDAPYKAFDLIKPPKVPTNTAETVLVPPPSPEQEAAAAAGEEARAQIDAWADEVEQSPTWRHPHCKRFRRLFRNKSKPGRGVMRKLRCGRIDCAECRGRMVAKLLARVARTLLLADPSETRYREGVLYLLRCPWQKWDAINKAIRRAAPESGRARVRTDGGEVVIAAEVAFPGARPVTPSQAALALAEAIRHELAPAKHAARLEGSWKAPHAAAEWELVKTICRAEAVRALAEEHGAKTRDLPITGGNSAGDFGFAFPGDTPEETIRQFWDRLRGSAGQPSPTIPITEPESSLGESRTEPPDGESWDFDSEGSRAAWGWD